MAFVFIQHLAAERKSNLEKLLSRETQMPVSTVREGMRVEPNNILQGRILD